MLWVQLAAQHLATAEQAPLAGSKTTPSVGEQRSSQTTTFITAGCPESAMTRPYLDHQLKIFTIMDNPEYAPNVLLQLRPIVPKWLPDWLNASLAVIDLKD